MSSIEEAAPKRELASEASTAPRQAPSQKRKKREAALAEELSEPAPVRKSQPSFVSDAERPRKTLDSISKPEKADRAPASDSPIEAAADEPAESNAIAAISGLFRDFWIWIGGGASHTSYSQTVTGFSDVEFGKINALSKSFRAGFFFADNFGLDLGYRNVPGEVSRSSTISVTEGSYKWQELDLNVLFRKNESSPWAIRAGVQMQETPFIVPLTANSITVTENNSSALVVGLEYRKMRKKLRLEYGLRYIHPISSSSEITSDFELKPRFSAAGSIGAAYEMKENFFLGAQLGATYQKNSFTFKNRSGSSFSGNQSVLSTSAEIRLGVEF